MNSPRNGPEPSRTPHACPPSRRGLSENRTRVGAGSHARPRHGRSDDKTLPGTAARATNPSARSSLRRASPIQALAAAPVRRSALLIVLPGRPEYTAVQSRTRTPPRHAPACHEGYAMGSRRTPGSHGNQPRGRTPSRRKRPSTRGRAVANAPPHGASCRKRPSRQRRRRARRSGPLTARVGPDGPLVSYTEIRADSAPPRREQEPTGRHPGGSKSPLGRPTPGARADSASPRREQEPTRRDPDRGQVVGGRSEEVRRR